MALFVVKHETCVTESLATGARSIATGTATRTVGERWFAASKTTRLTP